MIAEEGKAGRKPSERWAAILVPFSTATDKHSVLGPGLFESVYEAVLASELQKRGLHLASQQPIPVVYEGTRFEMGFRADLVVEDKVIVEIKSIAEIAALHKKQLLTYLRLADKRLGLSCSGR